ncbi:MAG: hypothetical protein ACLQBL_30195 [Polyangiaceae bacterium]
MPSAKRTRSSKRRPLRAKLQRLLALSLSTPLATAAAVASCRGGELPVTTPLDAASAEPRDGSVEASPSDGGVGTADGADEEANACAPVWIEAGVFGEDGACGNFVALPCGIPPQYPVSGCNPDVDLCVAVCPSEYFFICSFPPPTCVDGGVAPDATIYLDCSTCLGNIGRRPVGLVVPAARSAGAPLGSYFALASYLERASVDAFVQLGARLSRFGAPAGLRRRARRAADDERRHARVTARLARRYGGAAEAPSPCSTAHLTFEDFAVENAVEGCVRETFGALLSMHQAERAEDPEVARVMRRIAQDETEHAELAWAIHRWTTARLPPRGRQRVRRAQAEALARLRAGAGAWSMDVVRVAGMPEAAVEARLVEGFARSIFGAGGGGECPESGVQRDAP